MFGSGALGAVSSSSTSATYANSIEWNVNTSTLPSGAGHDLDSPGSPLTSGTGFTSLTFALTEDNVSKVNQTFTSVTAANTYFTDDLAKFLGLWSPGTTLDVLVSLSETVAGSGNGYGVNFLVGVDPPVATPDAGGPNVPSPVPEPATWSLFGLGVLGLGWAKLRRRTRRSA